MNADPIKIYLADLTHTGTVISSNIFPLAIGLVGAYLKEHLEYPLEIELFKSPEEFNQRLTDDPPAIIGFSNYSWNEQISLAFARRIKQCYPEIVTIFGGPNYGLEDEEIESYWSVEPPVDFYIVKEGEEAMLQLVRQLVEYKFDVNRIKNERLNIANTHYLHQGEIVNGDIIPRVNVGELPSPYLAGMMDKFFDDGYIPMIYTTRGCPFGCAFCTEGNAYYNKVSQREKTLSEELNFIAEHIIDQQELFIADANFGMFKQDIRKAKMIKDIKDKFHYPKNVIVSTGKNQKERVLNVATILDGSLTLAASVQSTDPVVLDNAKRSNINLLTLKEVGAKAADKAAGTYTEIILALPGDNKATHFRTLQDTIDAGFDIIRMYQFILLPQTEFNTPECRKKFDMVSRYRIMPRSFGRYDLLGEKIIVAETEQICISNNTMTLEDYLDCRELDLAVEIIHNGKVFEELSGLIRGLGLSWFEFIEHTFNKRHSAPNSVVEIFARFRNENTDYLRDSVDEIQSLVTDSFEQLVADEISTNEMSAAKAQATFLIMSDMHAFVYASAWEFLQQQAALSAEVKKY
ncbi:MAG: cobalamin-dependent protein, partial [Pseudomonadales bacterium]